MLTASPPGLPRAASRQLSRRVASTSRRRWNCGTDCQLAVVRSAITRQTEPTGAGESPSAGAGATSAAMIAPPGPLPLTAARSTPRLAASRRAFGDASVRRSGTRRRDLRNSRRRTGTASSDSPAASTQAIVSPTGTSSPSAAQIPASAPVAGASISTVTLSVSISSSGSPRSTASPSARSQRTTLPVSCAIPSAGMITTVGIAYCVPSTRADSATLSASDGLFRCDCVSRIPGSAPLTV